MGYEQPRLTVRMTLRYVYLAGEQDEGVRRDFAGCEDMATRGVGPAFSKPNNAADLDASNTGNIWWWRPAIDTSGDGASAGGVVVHGVRDAPTQKGDGLRRNEFKRVTPSREHQKNPHECQKAMARSRPAAARQLCASRIPSWWRRQRPGRLDRRFTPLRSERKTRPCD